MQDLESNIQVIEVIGRSARVFRSYVHISYVFKSVHEIKRNEDKLHQI